MKYSTTAEGVIPQLVDKKEINREAKVNTMTVSDTSYGEVLEIISYESYTDREGEKKTRRSKMTTWDSNKIKEIKELQGKNVFMFLSVVPKSFAKEDGEVIAYLDHRINFVKESKPKEGEPDKNVMDETDIVVPEINYDSDIKPEDIPF